MHLGDQRFLGRHVAQVTGEVHDLVVPQNHVRTPSGRRRLTLEAIQKPEGPGHVGPAIRDIAQEDHVPPPSAPASVAVHEPRVVEELQEPRVLSVDIADHEKRVHPREHALRDPILPS